ncbi:MAG: DUF5615 family PIN-like protein [Terracidiphilus sp.]
MKILIDMNLSPRWASLLQDAGIEAVHWSEIGSATAPDSGILSYAASNCFVILTNDLDFGIALAREDRATPSVAQIRGEDLRPASIGGQVIRALRQMQAELEAGARVTIDPKRTRLRLLPLRRKETMRTGSEPPED